MSGSTGGLAERGPTPSSAVALRIRALAGVSLLVPARPEARDLLAHAATALTPVVPVATGPLGSATGGTLAEPVLVRVSAGEVSVSVDVCVTAEASAPDVARAVGGVVREWCLVEHPDRRARVTVRIAGVD